jgi:hypothetical protein
MNVLAHDSPGSGEFISPHRDWRRKAAATRRAQDMPEVSLSGQGAGLSKDFCLTLCADLFFQMLDGAWFIP